MIDLRPYRSEAVVAVGNAWFRTCCPLVALPTGTGKSMVLAEIAEQIERIRPVWAADDARLAERNVTPRAERERELARAALDLERQAAEAERERLARIELDAAAFE